MLGMAARGGIYIRRVLARNVRRLRTARDMSQEELADAAHLAQSQISGIENGKANIRLHVVQDIAFGLGARLAELFDEATSKPAASARGRPARKAP